MLSSKMVSRAGQYYVDRVEGKTKELGSIFELMKGYRTQDSGTSNIETDSFTTRFERRIAKELLDSSMLPTTWTESEITEPYKKSAREVGFRLSEGNMPAPPPPTSKTAAPRSAYFGLFEHVKFGSVDREELMKTGKIYGPAAITAVSSNEVQATKQLDPPEPKPYLVNLRTRPPSPFLRKSSINSRVTRRVQNVQNDAKEQVEETKAKESEQNHVKFNDSGLPLKYGVLSPIKSRDKIKISSSAVASLKPRLPPSPSASMTSSKSNRRPNTTESEMVIRPKTSQKHSDPLAPRVSVSNSTVLIPKVQRSQIMTPMSLPGEMRAVDIQKVNRMYSNPDIIIESEKRVDHWLKDHMNIRKSSKKSKSKTPFTTSLKPFKLKRRGKKGRKVRSGRKQKSQDPNLIPDSRPVGPKIEGLSSPEVLAGVHINTNGGGESSQTSNLIIRTKALPFPRPRYKRIME